MVLEKVFQYTDDAEATVIIFYKITGYGVIAPADGSLFS